jgi:hypothetical protein
MVDLARIEGLPQLSPQGFLGGGFNFDTMNQLIMTPEQARQMSMTRDVKPPAVQNAINQAMQTGQSVSYSQPINTVAALPATPTPATPAPVVQTPLPITQPSVNVQNTGDMKMAKPETSSLGGDGVTETITRTAPAPFAEPFLQYGMSEALRQYQQGPYQYYPGETVVGFAPQTEQALRMQEQMALAGTPVGTAAQQYATDVLGGTFLGGNPMLSEAINRALDPVQARTTSDLALRGRLGSGAAANVMTRALGDVAADIAFRDYGAERARQQQVLGMAPALQQASYFDIGQLAGVGAARENLAQQQLASDIARFQFEQQAPAQALGQYQALVSGFPMGGTSSAIQPYFEPSKGQTFLGGAALGASLLPESASTPDRLIAGLLGGTIGSF